MLPDAGRRCWSFHCRHRRGHLGIWRGLRCEMALAFCTGATACGISVGYHSKASPDSRKLRDGVGRSPCPLHTSNVARIPPNSTRLEAPSDAADEREGPSKTQRKHEMHALQDLGRTLVGLDPERLATLALPERLVDAIALLRKVSKHEARRRQLQYIGRLMRDVDPAPLREAVSAWDKGSDRDRARFAATERWRDRLLDDPEGLDAFVAAHAGAPRAALAQLIVDARAERLRGAPPRRFRALFREIKRIIDAAQA
ncbi:MAG: DUF615 domain-containing protein [Betaproteobacteria bacterium]|nr:DUF615 domain-containing protein [Betaproteobacteria bacterium]